ncbi:hypothetical protein [Mycobacterium malmoense]|uniref:hypothetical protein n=1 Tax=Mycobacterium malmoense TaxID=1780 RepID=UPI0015A59E59|nr:hypothetical protein [Mycobacterium malmoense]
MSRKSLAARIRQRIRPAQPPEPELVRAGAQWPDPAGELLAAWRAEREAVTR